MTRLRALSVSPLTSRKTGLVSPHFTVTTPQRELCQPGAQMRKLRLSALPQGRRAGTECRPVRSHPQAALMMGLRRRGASRRQSTWQVEPLAPGPVLAEAGPPQGPHPQKGPPRSRSPARNLLRGLNGKGPARFLILCVVTPPRDDPLSGQTGVLGCRGRGVPVFPGLASFDGNVNPPPRRKASPTTSWHRRVNHGNSPVSDREEAEDARTRSLHGIHVLLNVVC